MARYLRNLWNHIVLGLRGISAGKVRTKLVAKDGKIIKEQYEAAMTDPRRI